MQLSKAEKTKFCILSTQRSGSTWLQDLLDSHPQINAFGELFLWWKQNGPTKTDQSSQQYLNQSDSSKLAPQLCKYKKYRRKIAPQLSLRPWVLFQYLDYFKSSFGDQNTIGFRLMYNQLAPRPELLIKFGLEKYKIIHLVRENYLDILISKASFQQNKFAHAKTSVKAQPVTLDTSSLIRDLMIRDSLVSSARGILSVLPNPVLEVSYESLRNDRDTTLKSITDFLDIQDKNFTFNSDLKKINTGAYDDKILNYDQVKKALEESKFINLLKS